MTKRSGTENDLQRFELSYGVHLENKAERERIVIEDRCGEAGVSGRLKT